MNGLKRISIRFRLVIGLVVSLLACTTSPTGRTQLKLLPDSQMEAMGAQAFTQMKEQTPISTDPNTVKYVNCVVAPILRVLPAELANKQWEIRIFKDETANAFALPGGKIGVHTGLFKVAKTDAQLAAVLGHEIGHVIAGHGNERMSEGLATQGGLSVVGALAKDSPYRQKIMGLLGIGAQVGILLPFSRRQESEADQIGQDLMADAGFDPEQSVQLWRNMQAASSGAPPQFLSTHPASETRIERLQAHMSEAKSRFQAAVSRGQAPHCVE